MGRANPGGCFSELQSLQPLAVWHEVPDTTARGADWWCLGLSLCVTLVLSISRLEQYHYYVGRLFRLLAASVFCFLRCNSTAVGLREWCCAMRVTSDAGLHQGATTVGARALVAWHVCCCCTKPIITPSKAGTTHVACVRYSAT
jgi:hypothetical protein